MNMDELNDLDLSNIGVWPWPVKAILVLLLCLGVGVAWYFLDTKEQYINLDRVEKKELDLRKSFEEKQAKAANLEKYKQQLDEMRESFGAMLRQLPDKTEVAELLVDVSQMGLASGLEFELFQPQGEIPKEFYAELPIKLRVVGGYHEFGKFVSGLAGLPRIVTIHDINIHAQPASRGSTDPNKKGELIMEATAKTYRYLDEEG